jgi:hypothetical protein
LKDRRFSIKQAYLMAIADGRLLYDPSALINTHHAQHRLPAISLRNEPVSVQ